MILPHDVFKIMRPDEVAECWASIDDTPGLYTALWACVGDYKAPSPEESEEPCYGVDCVDDFWDRFSDDHKKALNAAAEAEDRSWEWKTYEPDEAQEWTDYDPDC